MNATTKFLSAIVMSLAAAGAVRAESGTLAQKSLEIIRTVDPIFPDSAAQVTSAGEAAIAINVNAEGKLVDCLVLSYTRKAFATEALRALKQWKFVAATYEGKPVSVVTELDFDFRATGVVVSLSAMESLERIMNPLLREKLDYAPCGLKEIDRIPLPINVISPSYPASLAAKGVEGSVVIVFYIDEEGRVRMPAIQDAANMQLAELALGAISQWKFEPPTRHGVPVLVRASQCFNFMPKGGVPKVEAGAHM